MVVAPTSYLNARLEDRPTMVEASEEIALAELLEPPSGVAETEEVVHKKASLAPIPTDVPTTTEPSAETPVA